MLLRSSNNRRTHLITNNKICRKVILVQIYSNCRSLISKNKLKVICLDNKNHLKTHQDCKKAKFILLIWIITRILTSITIKNCNKNLWFKHHQQLRKQFQTISKIVTLSPRRLTSNKTKRLLINISKLRNLGWVHCCLPLPLI